MPNVRTIDIPASVKAHLMMFAARIEAGEPPVGRQFYGRVGADVWTVSLDRGHAGVEIEYLPDAGARPTLEAKERNLRDSISVLRADAKMSSLEDLEDADPSYASERQQAIQDFHKHAEQEIIRLTAELKEVHAALGQMNMAARRFITFEELMATLPKWELIEIGGEDADLRVRDFDYAEAEGGTDGADGGLPEDPVPSGDSVRAETDDGTVQEGEMETGAGGPEGNPDDVEDGVSVPVLVQPGSASAGLGGSPEGEGGVGEAPEDVQGEKPSPASKGRTNRNGGPKANVGRHARAKGKR